MDVMDLDWIGALLTSYYYNRDDKDVVAIIERTINRLNNTRQVHEDIDEDVDIFMGAIICRYGDYGTSPRYGWLEERYKIPVMNVLTEELEEYKGILSRSTDEVDYGTR